MKIWITIWLLISFLILVGLTKVATGPVPWPATILSVLLIVGGVLFMFSTRPMDALYKKLEPWIDRVLSPVFGKFFGWIDRQMAKLDKRYKGPENKIKAQRALLKLYLFFVGAFLFVSLLLLGHVIGFIEALPRNVILVDSFFMTMIFGICLCSALALGIKIIRDLIRLKRGQEIN